jgi:hypothetical protein
MSSSTAIGACHDATFVISLPSRHSLFASRQLMPFWLGRSLALPFFSSLVPRPTTRFKSVSTKTKPAEAG